MTTTHKQLIENREKKNVVVELQKATKILRKELKIGHKLLYTPKVGTIFNSIKLFARED